MIDSREIAQVTYFKGHEEAFRVMKHLHRGLFQKIRNPPDGIPKIGTFYGAQISFQDKK
jgi:hypothetical protein